MCVLKKMYTVTDRRGKSTKTGMFSEPEVRMAAKAGTRIFELVGDVKHSMEITQELTGLFTESGKGEKKKESEKSEEDGDIDL